ncbi:MAG: VapC toxin family PIN domain ribonuclease [Deltaproteobacteria bacterium]|nr:VapC toxin family PIN domain ribonuclease [Deltaproteobacteria bacterium]
MSLLDVNMLIALAWPSHLHHHKAGTWFANHSKLGWATCPMTQCAFVRISSNPKIIPEAVSPKEALALLVEIVRHPAHHFWKEDISLLDSKVPTDLLLGHRQVTDAYLLGLAIRYKGRLVTLDAGLSALLSKNSPHRKALCIL